MKMRRFFILLVFLFSACDFETLLSPEFDAPVKSFFDTYTNTAAIERHDYSEPPYQDSSRRLCFDSYKDYSVNFYLRNPQLYSLNLEAKFNSLSGVDTSEITVVQSEDKNSITLTLPQKFLVDSDEGKNISPTISLYEPMSGRSFPEYSFELYCNSKPPKVYNPTIINNGNSTFVIAFDMPEVVELVVRHKDLANIIINGVSYTLSVDSEGNFNFPDTTRFSTSWKSSYAEIGGKTFNHEDNDRAVYFETGEAFSADDKSYTIVLADAAGLTTEILASTVITKINKPSIYEVQESGREKTLDASKTISLSTLASTEKGSIRIKAPTTDNTGSALLTPVTLYYNIYNGTKKKAVFYNSGSFSGSKDISLAVGTWYVEVYAEATNYESSSPLKCDIRVADNSIYVSASGDDEGDGSASEPFATINGATGLNETGVIHDIISRVAEDAAIASKAYTIRVMGALSENVTLGDPLDGDGKLCTTGLNLTGDSGAASDSIASLTVDTTDSVPVSLKELTVGSVTVKAGKKLKLYDGAAITNADVEAAGLLTMEGSAKITNLILADGAYITLTGDLTSERAAEITLASSAYAIGTKILENNSYTESNCAKFKIVDNDPTDTKEWYVKSDGSLSHKVKFGPDAIENITVFENESDIEVTNEKTGFTYKFTAPEGYSYSWKVDGTETGTENVLILNAITWGTGIYDVYLTASKDGKTYSYHAQINHTGVSFTGTAEQCATYINNINTAATYNITVTGAVGSGSTEGLAKVANAIRGLDSEVLINLDASRTTKGSSITTYNDGEYFKNCTALKTIKLPSWMQYIIHDLFNGCTALTSVEIPSSVQYIGENAFEGCTSLTEVTLPVTISGTPESNDLKGIDNSAFKNCSSLAEVNFSGTKEQWKNINFGKTSLWREGIAASTVNCSNGEMDFNFILITSVLGGAIQPVNKTVSGSGTEADPFLFEEGIDIIEFIPLSDMPLSFTYVSGELQVSFSGGNRTGSFKIWLASGARTDTAQAGKSRTMKLYNNACSYSENYYFKLPQLSPIQGVTNTIKNMTASGTVTVDAELTADDFTSLKNALNELKTNNSDVLVDLDFSGATFTEIPANAFKDCSNITSVKLPEGLETIGKEAFYDCSNIQTIYFPKSLKTVGGFAFTSRYIENVYYPGSLADWCGIEMQVSPFTYTNTGITNLYLDGTLIEGELTIPAGVTRIGAHTFSRNKKITKVNLPDSVREIGDTAFEGTRITEINLPTTMDSIGEDAFRNCSLPSITLPEGITELKGTFNGCTSLTTLNIPSSLKSINSFTFQSCNNLSSITGSTTGWKKSGSSTEVELTAELLKKGGTYRRD